MSSLFVYRTFMRLFRGFVSFLLWSHYVVLAGLQTYKDPPASASEVLGLKMCVSVPRYEILFHIQMELINFLRAAVGI